MGFCSVALTASFIGYFYCVLGSRYCDFIWRLQNKWRTVGRKSTSSRKSSHHSSLTLLIIINTDLFHYNLKCLVTILSQLETRNPELGHRVTKSINFIWLVATQWIEPHQCFSLHCFLIFLWALYSPVFWINLLRSSELRFVVHFWATEF